MRKLMLSTLLCISVITFTEAQTSKGQLFLGGNLNFDLTATNGGSTGFALNMDPQAGYFIMDQLAFGF